jgi:hypothetical protein
MLIGLALAAGVISMSGRAVATAADHGPILSDCHGQIRTLAIQYTSQARPVVGPVYRDFLRQLPDDVTVYAACPTQDDYRDLLECIGPVDCRMVPVTVGHEITAWSRDRFLSAGRGDSVTLLGPLGADGAENWPARAGDLRVPAELATLAGVDYQRGDLFFDGGDFVCDGRRAFVAPGVIARNIQHTVTDKAHLLRELERIAGRPVVLLENGPQHHAGMFMMAAQENVIVVGDPRAGQRWLEQQSQAGAPPVVCPPEGPDFSDQVVARFDAVADAAVAAGCRVVRVPIVPGRNGRTFVTYLNVIIDQRDGRRIVYMPTYRGLEGLNQVAAGVWQSLDCQVCPVDCTDLYIHFGALRCLVNVVRRG